jgi:hypothetical protein
MSTLTCLLQIFEFAILSACSIMQSSPSPPSGARRRSSRFSFDASQVRRSLTVETAIGREQSTAESASVAASTKKAVVSPAASASGHGSPTASLSDSRSPRSSGSVPLTPIHPSLLQHSGRMSLTPRGSSTVRATSPRPPDRSPSLSVRLPVTTRRLSSRSNVGNSDAMEFSLQLPPPPPEPEPLKPSFLRARTNWRRAFAAVIVRATSLLRC